MAAAITFDISELIALDGRLEAAYQRSKDLSPLMDAIGMAMEASTDERFDDEASPSGAPWTKSAAAKARGGKTLTDSARLRGSVTHLASADRVEIGTNLIYAGVHQSGFDGPVTISSHERRGRSGKTHSVNSFIRDMAIEARPYLGIGGDDEQTIAELSADYLLEDLAA